MTKQAILLSCLLAQATALSSTSLSKLYGASYRRQPVFNMPAQPPKKLSRVYIENSERYSSPESAPMLNFSMA